jgi:hypothetical protein
VLSDARLALAHAGHCGSARALGRLTCWSSNSGVSPATQGRLLSARRRVISLRTEMLDGEQKQDPRHSPGSGRQEKPAALASAHPRVLPIREASGLALGWPVSAAGPRTVLRIGTCR